MFMAGEHHNAISHMDNLTAKYQYNSTFYAVQARA